MVRLVTFTPAPMVTPYPASTRAPTWTPEPTGTPAAVPTANPYESYTIDHLRTRKYGGGDLQNLGPMGQNDGFTRYSMEYPSDGLKVYGFVNVPSGEGPFPVIIALHGYVNPLEYVTLDYTTDAADGLTRQGYIVVHPNLRNFPPSDNGDIMFRAGYAVDVLNLIDLIQQNAGKPGLFEKTNAGRIGIWAHSMGGDVALKVAVVSPYVKAILLYSSMSGDEQKNSQYFNFMLGSDENRKEMLVSPAVFKAVSPFTYYRDISAAIQIHHGTGDTAIPIAWAQETCQALKDVGRKVECFYYGGADHTFRTRYMTDFSARMDDFFAKYLKN